MLVTVPGFFIRGSFTKTNRQAITRGTSCNTHKRQTMCWEQPIAEILLNRDYAACAGSIVPAAVKHGFPA